MSRSDTPDTRSSTEEVSALASRVRQLEDLEEIRALLYAYGRLLDERDLAGYAALFARSGTWTGPYIGSAAGPAAIEDLMRRKLEDAAPGSHHIMSNMMIHLSTDRSRAFSRWTYIIPGPAGSPSLALCGHYDDELVREDGRWKYQSRIVCGDLPGVG